MTLQEALEEYRERYGEGFPTMACMDMTDDEMRDLVVKCIEGGGAYDVREDVVY